MNPVKKIILFFIFVFIFIFVGSSQTFASLDYEISNFDSFIKINQDTSIEVREEIKAEFNIPKHGIIRVIPKIYSYKGKTINSRLSVISVTDGHANVPYEKTRLSQSVSLKIGDANKTITGEQTYIIRYRLENILQDYGEGLEFYWNITGHEWDTNILKSSAVIETPHAKAVKVNCFQGEVGTQNKNCEFSTDGQKIDFFSKETIIPGSDFTIVVQLDKNNSLIVPGLVKRSGILILDNFGYLLAVLPMSFLGLIWFKYGRDVRYSSDNVYFTPRDKKQRSVGIFERKFLPTVYSPINELTPSEVGTLIDEKVDIHDIVAEITELARLGYIKIEKLSKKGIFGKTDYVFVDISQGKNMDKLRPHQVKIFNSIFKDKNLSMVDDILKKFKSTGIEKLGYLSVKNNEGKLVLLSDLSQKFYLELGKIKNKLYERMEEMKYFPRNPDKIRTDYIVKFIGIFIGMGVFLIKWSMENYNFYPLVLYFISFFPILFFARSMPKRTAKGYSLTRQCVGLRYYLNVGKWRQEIAEKNMFFAEMLPLAISLGVVDKLAKDMQKLEVPPPDYLRGFTANTFAYDFARFSSMTSRNMVSTPPGQSFSGSSSWSGGSGFSGGGSSGGGFGGGGGGSW